MLSRGPGEVTGPIGRTENLSLAIGEFCEDVARSGDRGPIAVVLASSEKLHVRELGCENGDHLPNILPAGCVDDDASVLMPDGCLTDRRPRRGNGGQNRQPGGNQFDTTANVGRRDDPAPLERRSLG